MKLEDYKYEHYGQEAVVMGSGPSINGLSEKVLGLLLHDKITIGCNEIIHFPRRMDYYFIGDAGNKRRGYNSDPNKYKAYKATRQNFYRDPLYKATFRKIPKGLDGVYYPCLFNPSCLLPLAVEEIPPLYDCYSITFEMIQFAAYSGVQRIYLVGQDCDYTRGSFHTETVPPWVINHSNKILESWTLMEKWLTQHYPHIQVINVNPVKMRRFELFAL